ncbi:MAG: hypothetical protein JWN04_621, partial [Myxococcaceae bacterium]|nr:hypothetical protein [Myxococcaceae bacterium]
MTSRGKFKKSKVRPNQLLLGFGSPERSLISKPTKRGGTRSSVTRGRHVIYKGERFDSRNALARHLDVSPSLVGKWLPGAKVGQDVSSLVERGLARRVEQVLYNGVWYRSRRSLAAHLRIYVGAVTRWTADVPQGSDTADAIAKGFGTRRKAVFYEGRRFRSIHALSIHLGVGNDAVRKWVRGPVQHGSDVTADVNTGLNRTIWKNGYARALMYEGERYPSYGALARHLKVHLSTLQTWIKGNRDEDVTEAVNRGRAPKSKPPPPPPKPKKPPVKLLGRPKPVLYEDTRFDSFEKLAAHLGLPVARLSHWVAGVPKGQDLAMAIKRGSVRAVRPIGYEGTVYRSRLALAKHLKVNPNLLAQWVKDLQDGEELDAAVQRGMQSLVKPILYDGVWFTSRSALGHKMGLGRHIIQQATANCGAQEDCAEAIRQYQERGWTRGLPRPILHGGTPFESRRKLAEHLAITVDTLAAWLENCPEGIDVAEHLDRVRNESRRGRPKSISFLGVRYASHNALAEAVGVHGDTLRSWLKKGLPLEETIAAQVASAPPRKPAPRRKQIDWRAVTLQEVIAQTPVFTTKLANLDFSGAFLISDKNKYVDQIVCTLHGPINGPRQLNSLRSGAQPCRECASTQRAPHKPLEPRTLERAEAMAQERSLPVDLSHARLENVPMGRQGGKALKIFGARCMLHDEAINPFWWSQLKSSSVRCGQCSRGIYCHDEMASKLDEVHGGSLRILRYSGTVGGNSDIQCRVCAHEWPAALNNLLGSEKRRPTGCRVCSKRGYRERAIGTILVELEVSYAYQHPWKIDGFRRPLCSDYYIPARKLAIEYDGEQHFEERAIFGVSLKANRERDWRKSVYLEEQGIRIARIPFWETDLRAAVERSLEATQSM